MKVYLVNLDRHFERLAHMREQLRDVAFERVSAVDGALSPIRAEGLTRFEIACLESHRIAWRLFLQGPDAHACFLEDDIHLQPDFAALVADDSWVPAEAHAVKLDTYLQRVKLGRLRPAPGNRSVAPLYSRHQSGAAYILSRAGARRYLEPAAGPALPSDYLLFPRNPRRLGLILFQLTPAVAIQDHLRLANAGRRGFPTGIGEDRSRRPVGRRIVRECERLIEQAGDLREAIYLRFALRPVETTVRVG
jgi:glycosyl transferase family 25